MYFNLIPDYQPQKNYRGEFRYGLFVIVPFIPHFTEWSETKLGNFLKNWSFQIKNVIFFMIFCRYFAQSGEVKLFYRQHCNSFDYMCSAISKREKIKMIKVLFGLLRQSFETKRGSVNNGECQQKEKF